MISHFVCFSSDAMSECILKTVQACRGGGTSGQMSNAGERRIRTIIEYSKKYGDGLHKTLQDTLDKNPQLTLTVHRNCVSNYCSPQHCKEALRRKGDVDSAGVPSPAKRRRRSGMQEFDFQRHCIFCGEECNIPYIRTAKTLGDGDGHFYVDNWGLITISSMTLWKYAINELETNWQKRFVYESKVQ